MSPARATGWHPSLQSQLCRRQEGGKPKALLGWRVNSGYSGQLVSLDNW